MKTEFRCPVPGQLVDINGHEMHVFSQGQGEKTLVFIAIPGAAMCPTLDFKPLWSLLVDKHRIVVIEKSGLGWSEPTENPRDLDTVLDESKQALKHVGIDPPYYLVPNSMAGLVAIYWVQKHPSEVKAIIGLDSGVPDLYGVVKPPPMFLLKAIAFLSRLSIRSTSDYEMMTLCKKLLPSFQSASLSDHDRQVYIAYLRGGSTFTTTVHNEGKAIRESINYMKKIKEYPLPLDLPIYFFISNGKDKSFRFIRIKPKVWRRLLKAFVSEFKNGKYLELDCKHWVHAYEPETIAREINLFVGGII